MLRDYGSLASKNEKAKLNKPYQPPPPDFGPVFINEQWKATFGQHLKSCCLVVYGPSAKGKSVAVAQLLKGRTGVLNFSVREATDMALLTRTFIKALGIEGIYSGKWIWL